MDNLLKITNLFHGSYLDSQLEKGREVSKKHLINTLNYTNFQNGIILINFEHLKYGKTISLQAKPQPCVGEGLDCIWVETTGLTQKLKSYKFINFLIADGQKIILVKPDLIRISEEGISFNLPETCNELNSRKARRHSCEGINVEFIQNSVIFYGSLLDFNAISFRVEISTIPPQTFQWINPESTANIIIKNGQDTLYAGECRIIRQTSGQKTRSFVLKPVNNQMSRFKPKEFRSSRYKFTPSPNVIFRHPLTGKTINLEVEDLSGSGFSVEEYYDSSVLLPGMVIPQSEIEFTNAFKITCNAQVVYKNLYIAEDDKIHVKCGITFLDMDVINQGRLSSLLHHVADKKSYVCNRVDLDDLWKFFFEAGFVYPEKYALIHANKEKFKETYEKLYMQNPHIARHFIYQDKGIIFGHISMLRVFENTWLFHHHAASRASQKSAGLVVLDQIGRYVNDFYCLYSTHMDFIICYFRPDNKFPNRIFGNCAKFINEPRGCSIDSFVYFHLPKASVMWDLPEPSLLLDKAKPEDLLELESFYKYNSGGLMLQALDLDPGMVDSDQISKEYHKIGLKRVRHLFSLKRDGYLKAIIMVNISDIGLNLSNLTNCIHVFVLDPDNLSVNMLYSTLSQLSHYYEQDKIPILLYPVSYAESQLVRFDKIYNLWVLNIPHSGEHYLKYMRNLLNRAKHAQI